MMNEKAIIKLKHFKCQKLSSTRISLLLQACIQSCEDFAFASAQVRKAFAAGHVQKLQSRPIEENANTCNESLQSSFLNYELLLLLAS